VLDDDLLADLETVYRNRLAEARASGSRVVLTTAPRMDDLHGLLGEMDDPARLAAYNGLIRRLAASEPDVELLDLGPLFEQAGADARYPRFDGLHLDLEGAEHLAEDVLVPALLGIAAPT
jgi:lysophospholipase L1-like esterase